MVRPGRSFYRAYLASPRWQARRESRIAAAGGRCEFVAAGTRPGEPSVRCRRTDGLTVHHRTYARLGAERDEDLAVYCRFHHVLEHLLWRRCRRCGGPCLGDDAAAERWLKATLFQNGLDPDAPGFGRPGRGGFPDKEAWAVQVPDLCPSCRPVFAREKP